MTEPTVTPTTQATNPPPKNSILMLVVSVILLLAALGIILQGGGAMAFVAGALVAMGAVMLMPPVRRSAYAKNPTTFNAKAATIGGWILVVLGLVMAPKPAKVNSPNTSQVATTANATPEPVAQEPEEKPIDVSAGALFKAYNDNEVAADRQYKDVLMRVKGTVSSIDSDFSNDAVVRLSTGNMFQDVMASGDDAFNQAAAGLKKGQKVTMICRGGGEVVGTPSLRKCVIQ